MKSILYSRMFKRINQFSELVLTSDSFQPKLEIGLNTDNLFVDSLDFFRVWDSNIVLYKKSKIKQIFFLKRKLVLCRLSFVSKLMFYLSEKIKTLKTDGSIKICKNLLDFCMSFVSTIQKLTFYRLLVENYWTTLYISTCEFFQECQILKGLTCNCLLIQCSIFRRLQFEVFSIFYLDTISNDFLFSKLNMASYSFFSSSNQFLTLKMVFQYLFMSLFYYLNDLDCTFKFDILRLDESIQQFQKFREKVKFKQYWFQFPHFNVWKQDLQYNVSSIFFRLFLKIPKTTNKHIILNPSDIQSCIFHYSESFSKSVDAQTVELSLFSQFKSQFQLLIVNPKVFSLLIIHCYNFLNFYSILEVCNFYSCEIMNHLFYFHQNKSILIIYRQICQNLLQYWNLENQELFSIQSPAKWRNYWIYPLAKEFVMWQFDFIFPLYSSRHSSIVDSQLIFFQQENIQKHWFFQEKILNFSCFLVPSKWSLQLYLLKLKQIIHKFRGSTQLTLISVLGSKIRLWSNYYQWLAPSHLFSYCDSILFQFLWRWSVRRHSNKSKNWIKTKYFPFISNKKWNFATLFQLSPDSFFNQNCLFEFHDYISINPHLLYIQLPSHRKKSAIVPKHYSIFSHLKK